MPDIWHGAAITAIAPQRMSHTEANAWVITSSRNSIVHVALRNIYVAVYIYTTHRERAVQQALLGSVGVVR